MNNKQKIGYALLGAAAVRFVYERGWGFKTAGSLQNFVIKADAGGATLTLLVAAVGAYFVYKG
jgi:hypothetical protein